MNFSDLKIGVWGYGKEGQSLYKHIKAIGGYNELVVLVDDVMDIDVPYMMGQESKDKISSGYFDLVFKSPGISLYRPEIKQAQSQGTKFSSATNLWFSENNQTKKIVITGTKGKSTTSSLLYHVMKEAGLSVSFGGNVGMPLIDLKEQTKYTVLELSSYQLADLEYAPDIFVITNLFPEHLQWHVTHENYYNDKLSPLKMEEDFIVIANAGNDRLKNRLVYSDKEITWFNKERFSSVATQLKGEHNQENIQVVLTVCNILGLKEERVLPFIKNFQPLRHRLQEFQSKEGIVCVNDSISTTPETAIAAMKVYEDKNLIVILGGTDRGQDYAEMVEYIKTITIKTVLLLPSNGKRIEAQLNQSQFEGQVVFCDDLLQATEWAKTHAEKSDVVLLSPAAPSYDQFKNFEERGDLFIKFMKA